MHALGTSKTSPDTVREIEKLLESDSKEARNDRLTQALSTALVDFLWQGATVGALLWMTLVALRRPISAGTLSRQLSRTLCALDAAGTTVVTLLKAYAARATAPAMVPPALPAASPSMPQTLLQIWMVPESPRQPWLDVVQQWALPIWTAGVLLFSIRLLAGWLYAVRLRRRTSPADAATMTTTASIAPASASPGRYASPWNAGGGPKRDRWLRPTLLLPPRERQWD
jgi:hypothetical protein